MALNSKTSLILAILPTEPTHYVDVKITNPTKDHKTLIGQVAPNFGEKGMGNQFFMGFKIDPINPSPEYANWFKNKKEIPNGGIK